MIGKIFNKKKIIVTGHTGFKGAWLSISLYLLGARVYGISDKVKTKPSFYKSLAGIFTKSFFFNIYNFSKLKKTVVDIQPDYIFHLAGQSIVIDSYNYPLETFKTNTMGTINILESIRDFKKKIVIILVTSDKVYDNTGLNKKFKECDTLGTNDPYSASKTLAEFSIDSYAKSFLKKNKKVRFGIARAGNVIGGGDWNRYRLVPDCIKSWIKNSTVSIRNKNATRPWQHVLEPIFAYIFFALNLYKYKKNNGEAFNFGPKKNQNFKVSFIINMLSTIWGGGKYKFIGNKKFQESKLLSLNIQKAHKKLKWKPKLEIKEAIQMTIEWYKIYYYKRKKLLAFTKKQIKEYLLK